jgi:sugar phosphate isomerase/epimerase
MLDVDPRTMVRAASDAGFDGVGLRLSGEHRLDPTDLEDFRSELERTGLHVFDAEVHRIGTDTDPTALVRAAAEVGASRVLVVSDVPDLDVTKRQLGDVLRRCEQMGMAAAVEYMAWTTPSDPHDAIELADATGCQLVVDLLHHHRLGAGTSGLDDIVRSGRLGWVQISDASSDPPPGPDGLVHEARHARLPPGAGALPLQELLAHLPADVTISVEVQSDTLASSWPPAPRARLLANAARSVLNRRHR